MRILTRAVDTLIVVVTVGAALMTFEPVRQYGVSLFASAGVAGLVAGLAARPMLSNLIAGIQIAMTQPIRLDDEVVVENEWGRVEEITSTYVVVRLWDLRRLIVPLTYFIEKPFQNWTRESTSLIGSVLFYVDYTAPIERMRAKVDRDRDRPRRFGTATSSSCRSPTPRRARCELRVHRQRPHVRRRLRPALRDPREADRVPAAGISDLRCRRTAAGSRSRRTGEAAMFRLPPRRSAEARACIAARRRLRRGMPACLCLPLGCSDAGRLHEPASRQPGGTTDERVMGNLARARGVAIVAGAALRAAPTQRPPPSPGPREADPRRHPVQRRQCQ